MCVFYDSFLCFFCLVLFLMSQIVYYKCDCSCTYIYTCSYQISGGRNKSGGGGIPGPLYKTLYHA